MTLQGPHPEDRDCKGVSEDRVDSARDCALGRSTYRARGSRRRRAWSQPLGARHRTRWQRRLPSPSLDRGWRRSLQCGADGWMEGWGARWRQYNSDGQGQGRGCSRKRLPMQCALRWALASVARSGQAQAARAAQLCTVAARCDARTKCHFSRSGFRLRTLRTKAGQKSTRRVGPSVHGCHQRAAPNARVTRAGAL